MLFRSLQELSLAAERAKKLLSTKEKAPVVINYMGERVRVDLTRQTFDQLTEDLLSRTIELTREMFGEAEKKGYRLEDVSDVLLVGGSSKMPQVMNVKEAGVVVKGCSHITGGGFYENIPRMLPEGIRAVVEKGSYEVPAIFRLLQRKGQIEEQMMYNTYNMGLGMVLALAPEDAGKAVEAIRAAGEEAYVVGRCRAGEKGVDIC